MRTGRILSKHETTLRVIIRHCKVPCQLPHPTPSRQSRSVLEGGASSAVAVSACRPRAWTGLVASERFTTGEPFRSPVATPHPVSGMWGDIQTGWLRHAHLIDSDLHSIPIRGAEKPAPVGAGWHARFSGPVLRGWLTGSPSQPTLLADWHYHVVGSHASKAFRNHSQPDHWLVTTGSAPPRPSVPTVVGTQRRGFRLEPLR